MSEREPCARVLAYGKKCGHEKDSHHREYDSSPDGVPRAVYYACLAAFCNCPGYVAETKRHP